MTFCNLEKDEKTFDYVKEYILWFAQHNNKGFLNLDTNLQLHEIQHHLELNPNDDKNKEILSWISRYSKEFRIYLNTIKIVFAVWYCSGHESIMDWADFCLIIDRLDEIKGVCLDEVMMDGDPKSLDR